MTRSEATVTQLSEEPGLRDGRAYLLLLAWPQFSHLSNGPGTICLLTPFSCPQRSRAVGEVTNGKGLWNRRWELVLRILRGSVLQPSRGDRARGSSLCKGWQGEKETGFLELQIEKGRPYRVPESLQKVGPSHSFS